MLLPRWVLTFGHTLYSISFHNAFDAAVFSSAENISVKCLKG